MANDAEDFVLFRDCGGTLEAGMLRAHLEGAGIAVQVRGESTAGVQPMLGWANGVQVLVRRDQLSDAQVLIAEGKPVLDQAGGSSVEGAVCPVHEQDAISTCDRCGTYICARCEVLGSPPLCEDCVGREADAVRRPKWPGQVKKTGATLYLLVVGMIVIAAVLRLVL